MLSQGHCRHGVFLPGIRFAHRIFALADVGEGIADAVVLEWKVAPGDPVHTNQTLLEIETVKAIV
ncbi:biotin/lipoyl-containing protein, partial [Nocardia noduli]|uniref:biotin/lipoyl-containing protein n=1 Tax=Nocardia noduli TaxID=2815722 RepID=UPI0027DEABB1